MGEENYTKNSNKFRIQILSKVVLSFLHGGLCFFLNTLTKFSIDQIDALKSTVNIADKCEMCLIY